MAKQSNNTKKTNDEKLADVKAVLEAQEAISALPEMTVERLTQFTDARDAVSVNNYALVELGVSQTMSELQSKGFGLVDGLSITNFKIPVIAQGYYAGINGDSASRKWAVQSTRLRTASQLIQDEPIGVINLPYGYFGASVRLPSYDLKNAILSNQFISDALKDSESLSLLVDIQKSISDYIDSNLVAVKNPGREFQSLFLYGFVNNQAVVDEIALQQLLAAIVVGSPSSTLSFVPIKGDNNQSSLSSFGRRVEQAVMNRGAADSSNPQFENSGLSNFMQRNPTFPLIKKKGVSNLQTHFTAHSKMSEAVISYFMEKVRISQFDLKPRLGHLNKLMKTKKRRVVIKEIKIRFQGEKIDAASVQQGVIDGTNVTGLGLKDSLPLDFIVKKYTSADALEAILVGTTLIMNVTIPQWISNGLSSFELASLEYVLTNKLKTDQTLMSSSSLRDLSYSGITLGRADFRRHFVRTPGWNSLTWDETRRTFYYQKDKSEADFSDVRGGADRKLKGENGIAPFTLEGAAEICASLATTHSYPRGVARYAGKEGANNDDGDRRDAKRGDKRQAPFDASKSNSILQGDVNSSKDDFSLTLGGHVALNKMTQLVSLHWMDLMLIAYSTDFRDRLEVGGAARSVYLSVTEIEDIITEEYLNAAVFAGWNEGNDITRSRQVFFGRFKS